MRRVAMLAGLAVACTKATPPETPPPAVPPRVAPVAMAQPAPAPAPVPKAGCVDPAVDAPKRQSGVKSRASTLDLDGDGVPDPMFVGFCSMMGGNCQTYLYASNHGCPRYVGVVEQTEVSSGPYCADPPSGGTPCRLSTSRMMIHGEIYEYFYTYGAGGYVESGVGHEGPRPPPGKD